VVKILSLVERNLRVLLRLASPPLRSPAAKFTIFPEMSFGANIGACFAQNHAEQSIKEKSYLCDDKTTQYD
jgi:hypothetical protein